ncbi:AMP-binding protein [Burkholderia sp. Ac-20353]|uniref:AMP-binding protein n=1 Tax=Burkholderia sp. Ac-20353 TaxID=2703894 RepID=UPI00197BED03|nr:AMP-binding protein [Burkholderia sp. Ac-20353]MBN3788564.1 AMP-binding protein [Burkholderia sp. Ac-20353]
MPRTMIDQLSAAAQRAPDQPFCFYENRVTTFGELWTRSRRFAGALKEMGIPQGQRVAYLGKNTDRLLEVIFGAAIARNTCVVLNWRLALPELREILVDSGATIVCADFEFVEHARRLADQIDAVTRIVSIDLPARPDDARVIDYDALVDSAPVLSPDGIDADDDFLQLYTSGTTGKPKGVPQTHAMHLSQLEQWESRIGPFPAGDRFLVFMPLFHAAGITYPLFAISYGTQVEIHRAAVPEKIIEALASGRISSMVAVPTVLSMLVPKLTPGAFPALKRVHYGASGISRELLQKMMDVLGCDLVQIYAATETTAALTMLTADDHRRANGALWSSVGKPADSVQLKIGAIEDGRTQAPGQVGEILVRSNSVLRGYWRNEAATREALRDGWYHTGDLGYLDEDGYCHIVDRFKDMIISGGENVYSSEVENVLAQFPEFAEYAVVGTPDPQWGELVTACVTYRPGIAPLTLEELQSRARNLLAGYKVPRRLEVFSALPRNPMGKLQKHALRNVIRERMALPAVRGL